MSYSLTGIVKDAIPLHSDAEAQKIVRAVINYCILTQQTFETVVASGIPEPTDLLAAFQSFVREFNSRLAFVEFQKKLALKGFSGDIEEFLPEIKTEDRRRIFEHGTFNELVNSINQAVDNAGQVPDAETASLNSSPARGSELPEDEISVSRARSATAFLTGSGILQSALHQKLMEESDFYFCLQLAKASLGATEEDQAKKTIYEQLQNYIATAVTSDTAGKEAVMGAVIHYVKEKALSLTDSKIKPFVDHMLRMAEQAQIFEKYRAKVRPFWQVFLHAERIAAKNNSAREIESVMLNNFQQLAWGKVSTCIKEIHSPDLAKAGFWTTEYQQKEIAAQFSLALLSNFYFERTEGVPAPLDSNLLEMLRPLESAQHSMLSRE